MHNVLGSGFLEIELSGLDYDFILGKVVVHVEKDDPTGLNKTECSFKLETLQDISKEMKVEKEQLEKAPEFKNFKPLKKW